MTIMMLVGWIMTTEGREGRYSRGVFLLAHHIPTANEDNTTAAIPLHRTFDGVYDLK